jgi:hypothetical protein
MKEDEEEELSDTIIIANKNISLAVATLSRLLASNYKWSN